MLSEPNHAGNIIIILANLPDFLRTPILKKRMAEFFSMSDSEKCEMIDNALEAGPTIPFPNFAKLFRTWLEILCTVSDENRAMMFSHYLTRIANSPQKIVDFNLDGIFEIFSNLDDLKVQILATTIKMIIENLDDDSKKRILLLCPDNARKLIGV